MNKKRIMVWGIILLGALMLTNCAVYDNGYYGYPYYYDFDSGYPSYGHDYEFREHHEGGEHREFREHYEEGEHHHDRD